MAHTHDEDVSTRVITDPTGSSVDNVVRPAETIKQAPDSTQAAAPRDKPFRFLDLPRELRDKIYALVKCPLVGFTCSKDDDYLYIPRLRCPAFCASPLLLISRAFKQEYEEEVYRTAVFTITIPLHLQPQACQFTHESVRILEKARTVVAELEITSIYEGESAFDAETVPLVRSHITSLLGLCPSLRSLEICLPTHTSTIEDSVANSFQPSRVFDIQLDPAHAHVAFSICFYFPNEVLFCFVEGHWHRHTRYEIRLGQYLSYLEDNRIAYRGTKAQDASSWHGIHLETVRAGEFDMAKAIADFQNSEKCDECSEDESEHDEEAALEADHEWDFEYDDEFMLDYDD